MKSRQQPGRTAVHAMAALALAILLPAAGLVAEGLQPTSGAGPVHTSTTQSGPARPSAAAATAALSRPGTSDWLSTAGGGTGQAAPGDLVPATTDACRTAAMSVALGPPQGTAGVVYRQLRFTNTSTRPCVLHGFPGVSWVTGDLHTQVGPAAEQEGEKADPITLQPKEIASATLTLMNVGNFDPALCRPAPVKGLRVYLPGDIASEFIALAGNACSGKPKGPQLKVRTVVPGPGRS